MSDTPEQQHSSALDYTAAYKATFISFATSHLLTFPQKYTIYRKMPMLVARQERTLAIDGVYIHVRSSSAAVIFTPDGSSNNRSCLQQTKQKQFSIMVKRHHIILRVSRIASNQQLHLPFSNLS
jgi:SAPK-interacting protein 1 (Sin1), Pleckstrin-homology